MRLPGATALLLLAAGCGGGEGAEVPEGPRVPVAERPAFPGPAPREGPGSARAWPGEPGEFTRSREAMVDRYLRAIGVGDPRVFRAMGAVPRHRFVPKELERSAYDNTPLPIGHGQTISAPDVVGYMTQALQVDAGDRVLDVGTGSGYQAAVLAELGCRVYSVEILEPLAASSAMRLGEIGYDRVTVRCGDGYLGWPEEAPFDGILVAAAPDHVPKPLVDQLAPGANLVLPVGAEGAVQRLLVVTKREDGTVEERETLAVRFVPMTRK